MESHRYVVFQVVFDENCLSAAQPFCDHVRMKNLR